jgi:UDP:flavonoid glycosyltransferase YjiC (YdhE family)
VVEDFVDFNALMPVAKLFVSNGGAGSVMHALARGVPVVTAGKLEGKNDINVRLQARGLSVDLGTERPSAKAVAAAIAKVLGDDGYARRAAAARDELATHDTNAIIERAVVGHAAATHAAVMR